jgi:hypothetical protein
MQAIVYGRIELQVSIQQLAEQTRDYPISTASGDRIPSRKNKYIAQENKVTTASIGIKIDTICMCIADKLFLAT